MSEPEAHAAPRALALGALRDSLMKAATLAEECAASAQTAGDDALAELWRDQAAAYRATFATTAAGASELWSAAVQMRAALEALDNGYVRCASCRAWGHFGEPVGHEPDCVALAWDAAVRGVRCDDRAQPDGG